jgi:hypothetical protein
MAYHYRLNNQEVEISATAVKSHYAVEWCGFKIGTIYVDDSDPVTGRPIWKSDKPQLAEVADEIGEYIEAVVR